jgi:uncharacterized surface protein with fasciclin (FAS1) repeats/plastocyanin
MSSLPLSVSADSTQDIPTNAQNTGVHDSLVSALSHAGLVETLQGDGPFTVFAPTDAAFAAAGIDLADYDTPEENATLVDILTYHVVSGAVASSDVTDGMVATMLNGGDAVFAVASDGTVTIEGAKVTTADVQASNGVIHIIDAVIMPPVVVQSVDVYVDGGSFNSPYFNFYTDSAGTTQLNALDITQTYNFHRLNSATSHPFYISDAGYGQAATTALMLSGDGSESSGITGSESFTLSFASSITSDATVNFFCTVHSTMVSEFVLTGFPVTVTDIPAVAQSTGVHDSLVAALTKASLVATLQGAGPFTVFAPTDAAFADAGIDLAAFETEAEIAVLADILLYHVAAGAVASTDVTDGLTVTMVNGDEATFAVTADAVLIEGATVTEADVQASNGVVHVIDKVLMPPADPVVLSDIPTIAQSTGVHDSLVAALTKASLVATLQGDGPFTVFAPTDAAFTEAGIDLAAFETDEEIATLADILLYHVAAGAVASTDVTDGLTVTMVNGDEATFAVTADAVLIEGATVTSADVIASNGVIHVIDKVLTPPADTPVDPVEPVSPGDIPTVATGTGIHTALVAALAKANLVSALQAEGPFTVFAPTDEAFTAAGIDLDTFVSEAEIATLADILTYHVYVGAVASTDVTDGMTVAMLNGDNASFTVTADGVMIEGATVVSADVIASNGVIHVIDKVLTPPADTPVDPVVDPVLATCDVTVRIAPSGLKFSPAEVSITAGQTVCWQWTDESMAHNVREVDGDMSTTFKANGVNSGESLTTVDFRYTFDTDSTTFYYACEPHLATGMYGKVIVGDGGAVAAPPMDESGDSDSDEAESVPGFLTVMTTVALAGAAIVSSRRDE